MSADEVMKHKYVFALFPVRLWEIRNRFREPAGWAWLRRVKMHETMEGWLAYASEQQCSPPSAEGQHDT